MQANVVVLQCWNLTPLTTDQYFWAREHLAVRLTVLRVSSLLATRDSRRVMQEAKTDDKQSDLQVVVFYGKANGVTEGLKNYKRLAKDPKMRVVDVELFDFEANVVASVAVIASISAVAPRGREQVGRRQAFKRNWSGEVHVDVGVPFNAF